MLRLMLFRHAHADRPEGVADHERSLSARGVQEAQSMGLHMQAHNLVPDVVIVSTARRTQQTWAMSSEAGGFATTQVNEPRIYESTAGELLEVVREQDATHSCIMLVGHNPGMERLAAWLIDTGEPAALTRLQREFVVGGLAIIEFEAESWAQLDVQSGMLIRFDTPESV